MAPNEQQLARQTPDQPKTPLEHMDMETGESIQIGRFGASADNASMVAKDLPWQGLSQEPVTQEADEVLRAPVDPSTEIDIKPTGEVYMSHVFVRERLNRAFRPMGWALRPLSALRYDEQTSTMYQQWGLYVRGQFASAAVGSMQYQPKNDRMDFADAAEGVKSNALVRCCKDFGVGRECWDRRYADKWRADHAVQVFIEGGGKPQWRRLDALPFYKESRPTKESPNKEKWAEQMKALGKAVSDDDTRSGMQRPQAQQQQARSQQPAPPARPAAPQPPATPAAGSSPTATPAAPQPDPVAAPAPAAPVSAPQGEDRASRIRECKIVKQDGNRKLHKIVMFNDAVFYTFSTTLYAVAQDFSAQGARVSIDFEEKITPQGRFNMVKGIAALDVAREPGSDDDITGMMEG